MNLTQLRHTTERTHSFANRFYSCTKGCILAADNRKGRNYKSKKNKPKVVVIHLSSVSHSGFGIHNGILSVGEGSSSTVRTSNNNNY